MNSSTNTPHTHLPPPLSTIFNFRVNFHCCWLWQFVYSWLLAGMVLIAAADAVHLFCFCLFFFYVVDGNCWWIELNWNMGLIGRSKRKQTPPHWQVEYCETSIMAQQQQWHKKRIIMFNNNDVFQQSTRQCDFNLVFFFQFWNKKPVLDKFFAFFFGSSRKETIETVTELFFEDPSTWRFI